MWKAKRKSKKLPTDQSKQLLKHKTRRTSENIISFRCFPCKRKGEKYGQKSYPGICKKIS